MRPIIKIEETKYGKTLDVVREFTGDIYRWHESTWRLSTDVVEWIPAPVIEET